jgi:large subunit ribosomal protein L14e
MTAMDVGRVCVKLTGREEGKRCVIVDILDRNFVVVLGPEVRRRRVNMNHLAPLEDVLEINRNSTDEEIVSKF